MAKKTNSVGLDIGATAVRAAEVTSSAQGGDVELVRYAEQSLPPNAVRDGEVVDQLAVTQAIKSLWAQGDFSTKDVILGVGNQRVAVRPMTLAKMPYAELQASLPFQVQESLPMPADEAVMSFLPTYETQSELGVSWEGLLVAAWKEGVMTNVRAVESAGLKPVSIDLCGFALVRSMARGALAQGTTALVDIGARITTVVVTTDAVPRFVRVLSTGAENLTETLARSTGMGLQDAGQILRTQGLNAVNAPEYASAAGPFGDATRTLLEGIRSSIGFYAQNNPTAPVQVVVLTGGGATMPGLGQTIASATRTRALLGNPLEGVSMGRKVGGADAFRGREGTMAMTIGLGLGVAA
ncbi:type IV pilus assembly protein PilM [Demequina aurantiaca]|uniref:type IV pilus assembly protein PilM n=1 Tax=Demequina aurantiaca TaxID=676200 RepID=UPI0007838512|nr:type IV pilus assembly protein PilM [Demequina aurantiaca]